MAPTGPIFKTVISASCPPVQPVNRKLCNMRWAFLLAETFPDCQKSLHILLAVRKKRIRFYEYLYKL